ncbi:MAG: cation transporter [Bacteroidetes bacterium]|nr:cation transporter [Bacteroidota bacterium]
MSGNQPINHPADEGIKPVLLGIIVNMILAGAKGAAGFFGNSQALIADAVESASDVLSSVIVFVGLKASSIKPDLNHPYGHGKAEPLAGGIVSLFLIVSAFLIAITSVRYIITPHDTPAGYTLIVLVITILIKEGMYKYVVRKGNQLSSSSLKADAWHHRSDAITSLIAFIGITISLLGGNGYESADDWAAMVGSIVIGFNGYRILKLSFNEMMDAAPSSAFSEEIIKIAAAVEKVEGIDKCHVRKMGLEYFVDLHVVVNRNLTVEEGHAIAHNVKRKIRELKPAIHDVLIHIEPTKS